MGQSDGSINESADSTTARLGGRIRRRSRVGLRERILERTQTLRVDPRRSCAAAEQISMGQGSHGFLLRGAERTAQQYSAELAPLTQFERRLAQRSLASRLESHHPLAIRAAGARGSERYSIA